MSHLGSRRLRSSPIPSFATPTSSKNNQTEHISELKAKYFDYAMWLRAASRKNREPMFTHELLKHSLCQMGIDSTQAEQLVSTCSWYVYQFHKELETDPSKRMTPTSTDKSKTSTSQKQTRKTRKTKTKTRSTHRENSDDSTRDRNQQHKENIIPSAPPPTRQKYTVLPSIHPNDSCNSPRPRHVDFDQENLSQKGKSSHWKSATNKIRHLPKIRQTDTETVTSHAETSTETFPIELDLMSSQRSFHKGTVLPTRSILRKQLSSNSSMGSPDNNHRINRPRLLTPSSTILDEVPLGTRSQRLFGGSECFAQIMNELEEQNSHNFE